MKQYLIKRIFIIMLVMTFFANICTFAFATEGLLISSNEDEQVLEEVENVVDGNVDELVTDTNEIVENQVRTTPDFSNVTKEKTYAEEEIREGCLVDTSTASGALYVTLQRAMKIGEFLFNIIGGLLILIAIINGVKNYKNKKTTEEKIGEVKTKPKPVLFHIIMGSLLLMVAGILHVITNFAAKPIIYIYPKEKTKVKVKVPKKEKLLVTYPKYEDEWEVEAEPNGDLTDVKTGRKLYALYWEGITNMKVDFKEGFVVKGEDTLKFLEEKLEILGLNEREAEEFIVYWLPLMEKNRYNFIKFRLTEEIEEDMPLEITPKPDTLIRINMAFKPLPIKIDVKEQVLPKTERNGYTVVEWGGTRL